MSALQLLQKADKYQIFEEWLGLNGAEFSQLELRSYDDDSSGKYSHDHDMDGNTTSEEKKETIDASDNVNSSTMNLESNNPISSDSEMRGVHAKTNISIDAICVAIPKKCLITVEMGQATDIGQIILRSDLDLDAPKHIFLMIFLLWDLKVNGEKSFFKPYYDILPKTLSNIPIFWNNIELEYLKGSYLLTQISDRTDAITEDYDAICHVAPQLRDIASLEEFKWARMCVCSRNFGLQIDGHRTSALVPHADMLNHHRPRETKWSFDDELQAFTITTLEPIFAGSQVFDSYGQKCNHRFLLNYGFAVENNRELDGFCPNEVPIELSIPEDDTLMDSRTEFWMRGENDIHSRSGVENSNQDLSAILAAASAASVGNVNGTNIARAFEAVAGAISDSHAARSSASIGSDESAPLLRRVRVCVSNNENTRILFSMLRVLGADEEDLLAMGTAPTLPFGDSGCSQYLSRALRGYTSANPDNASFLTMQHAAFFRTCKDIRNPINLRNEKAAMRLLLKVVASALSKYPCSLERDIADLADEISCLRFSNQRHAKIQVRGEKEILHHFSFWARTAIDLIEIIELEIGFEKRRPSSPSEKAPQPGFQSIVQAMEDDDTLHFTVIRYCCDVLGALRKEAIQTIRQEHGEKLLNRGEGFN